MVPLVGLEVACCDGEVERDDGLEVVWGAIAVDVVVVGCWVVVVLDMCDGLVAKASVGALAS